VVVIAAEVEVEVDAVNVVVVVVVVGNVVVTAFGSLHFVELQQHACFWLQIS
jgi:hypothetical protein